MGQLAKAAQAKGIQAQPEQKSLADVIKGQWGKIEAVMPKHLSSERLYQLTISAINHEPKLGQCDVKTLLSCVMKCSALGVEPSAVDGLGRAYILPYRNNKRGIMEATFILGYKGMIDLARRSGEIASIASRAVYEGDVFDYEFGLEERCKHVPQAVERTPDKLTHVYMVAKFKDGGYYLDVMTRGEVEAIRKRSKAGNSGPWVTDYEAMAKKTVLRRAFPYLPVSVEAQSAASADESTGGYESVLGVPVVDDSPLEVEPESVEDVHPATAVCQGCGHIVEGCAPDATLEDLNQVGCCPNPSYTWYDAGDGVDA